MLSTTFCMLWRSFLILFNNRCPLNYLYLNLQSPFSCSLVIMSTINQNKNQHYGRKRASSQTCKERVHLIGEWPDMHRDSASDWLTCLIGNTMLSRLLLVHVPSSELCYHHPVFTKYNYIILSLMFCHHYA